MVSMLALSVVDHGLEFCLKLVFAASLLSMQN
jgi:hypothetical protein